MKGTLKSKRDVERLFQEGRRSSSSMMTVLCLESSGRGRCAFIAGKKLGPAPFRSRCKRVMRAAARELSLPCQGYDLVFIARRKLAFAAHGKVLDQMSASLAKLGVTR